jgi:hypothetical protein
MRPPTVEAHMNDLRHDDLTKSLVRTNSPLISTMDRVPATAAYLYQAGQGRRSGETDSMLQRMFDLERRLPAWLRPTFRGGLFIFGMGLGVAGKLFVLAILATLMLLAGAGRGLALFFGLLGAAVISGAVGGTIHGIMQPMENWGRVGSWLRWTLANFGFVTTSVILLPEGPFSLREPIIFAIAAGASALGAGCQILLDDRRPGRPSPRRFRLLQSRKRLWAEAARASARRNSRLAHDGDPNL